MKAPSLLHTRDYDSPHGTYSLCVITSCTHTKGFLLSPPRCAGREIIANLAKAAGLATMIAAMRPDIDNIDEYVRNTTARAFSVVASALGVPALLPFLKAVCLSKKSWQVRREPRQHVLGGSMWTPPPDFTA